MVGAVLLTPQPQLGNVLYTLCGQDGGCNVHADISGGELLTTVTAKREENINRLRIVLEVC